MLHLLNWKLHSIATSAEERCKLPHRYSKPTRVFTPVTKNILKEKISSRLRDGPHCVHGI